MATSIDDNTADEQSDKSRYQLINICCTGTLFIKFPAVKARLNPLPFLQRKPPDNSFQQLRIVLPVGRGEKCPSVKPVQKIFSAPDAVLLV